MLPTIKPSKKLIYLDHAATTPVDPRVKKAMDPFWSTGFGNPSSLYKKGREASIVITKARESVASVLGVRPEEIIFTAGGTESINLAIFGVVQQHKNAGHQKPHLITSAIEHHAVLRSFEALAGEGCNTTYVGVDGNGFIKVDELKAAVRPETILISVMLANNEVGTVEPVAEIGKWLRQVNAQRLEQKLPRILFHTDACQAAGFMDLDPGYLGVDLMSVNGSKIYGPKQTGALFVRSGVAISPLVHGGGQEKNLRSGTENVPGIVGFAEALKLAVHSRAKENKRLKTLRDYFITQLLKKIPGTILNGPSPFSNLPKVSKVLTEDGRLPNNVNVFFEGVEGETLTLYLDSYNIAVSTGSACTTSSADPSHVLLALGLTPAQALGAVRFTFGKGTARQDLDYVLKVLPGVVEELRRVNLK